MTKQILSDLDVEVLSSVEAIIHPVAATFRDKKALGHFLLTSEHIRRTNVRTGMIKLSIKEARTMEKSEKSRVLIAGESWNIVTTHIKGFDSMTTSGYEEAVGPLQNALEASGFAVDFLPNHLAAEKFPSFRQELEPYQAVILSGTGLIRWD